MERVREQGVARCAASSHSVRFNRYHFSYFYTLKSLYLQLKRGEDKSEKPVLANGVL